MKQLSLPERMDGLERQMAALIGRMDSHSLYIVNTVLPELEAMMDRMEKVYVSDQRFKELGNAVADLAAIIYKIRNGEELTGGRPHPRVRPN